MKNILRFLFTPLLLLLLALKLYRKQDGMLYEYKMGVRCDAGRE